MTMSAISSLAGASFWKMSGSGNDFVFFDGRSVPLEVATDPAIVRAVCARQEGVGADGVVVLAPPAAEDAGDGLHFQMIYCNADGSRAGMCGNAALCSTALAAEWKLAPAAGMRFRTDSGIVSARLCEGGPEIDLAAVYDVRADAGLPLEPGERRLGFAQVGVPHLVVLCRDVEQVDVVERGRRLRHDASLADGANVNFVSALADSRFAIRTFERGVEAETLACGTGATASGILLTAWGDSSTGERVALVTRSGMELVVTPNTTSATRQPALRGSARVVFTGRLGEAFGA